MRILVIYHSGVGSTKVIATEYFRLLKEQVKTQLMAIEEIKNFGILDEYDYFVIGFPTYHCEPSKSIKAFIKQVSASKQPKKVFLFTTCGWYSANTLRIFAKLCQQKNLKVVGSMVYRCPASDGTLLAPWMPSLFKFEKGIGQKVQSSIDLIRESFQLEESVECIPQFKGYSILNYPNKLAGAKLYKPTIYVHTEQCIKCKKCISECPHKCLDLNHEGMISYNKQNCEHCYRCIHHCPMRALSLSKKKVVKKQLTREYLKRAFRS